MKPTELLSNLPLKNNSKLNLETKPNKKVVFVGSPQATTKKLKIQDQRSRTQQRPKLRTLEKKDRKDKITKLIREETKQDKR